ncbi:hypothetical protein P154DRAFT_523132 [Amniculicola lignicola CBS 123094]|uniref:Uncharacterized protein n=1 Tax=Amniculicola lignicola CBS 123094 TaxID=1392246 RepID=A0A6A5WF76_9PLEO|nr:hypothetical protein P154DRAFT_523132 [Amniculicola lignicola CBS 123094]
MEDRSHGDIACPDSIEAYSEPDEYVIEDSIQIFRKYLVSEWTRTKTPYGLDAALAKATTSGPDCTERIFLNAGFKAWLAYFLATPGEGHFEGRQAQVEAMAVFQNHSIKDRRLTAERVAKIIPHSTVQAAISKMLQEPKRRRLLPPTKD